MNNEDSVKLQRRIRFGRGLSAEQERSTMVRLAIVPMGRFREMTAGDMHMRRGAMNHEQETPHQGGKRIIDTATNEDACAINLGPSSGMRFVDILENPPE